jgi:hypothetical protein
VVNNSLNLIPCPRNCGAQFDRRHANDHTCGSPVTAPRTAGALVACPAGCGVQYDRDHKMDHYCGPGRPA